MTSFESAPVTPELIMAAHLENACRPGGTMYEIASNMVTAEGGLTPIEVAEAIRPSTKPGQVPKTRWQRLEEVGDVLNGMIDHNEREILALADTMGLRDPLSITEERKARVVKNHAVIIVEGGAGKTSVVRRGLAVELAKELYGDAASSMTIYQLGSGRSITPLGKDGSPNKEHELARTIAGGNLADGDPFTEFDVCVATAKAGGYEVKTTELPEEEKEVHGVEKIVYAHRPGESQLVIIQPYVPSGSKTQGLKNGFTALHKLGVLVDGSQPIPVTSGQYRTKDEVQARTWATEGGVGIKPPVAFGDEAGFATVHAGVKHVTAARSTAAYLQELAVLVQRGMLD